MQEKADGALVEDIRRGQKGKFGSGGCVNAGEAWLWAAVTESYMKK